MAITEPDLQVIMNQAAQLAAKNKRLLEVLRRTAHRYHAARCQWPATTFEECKNLVCADIRAELEEKCGDT